MKFLARGASKYPYGSDNGPHLWPKLDQIMAPVVETQKTPQRR